MKKNDIIISNESGLLVNLDLQFFAENDEDEKAVLMDYEAVKKHQLKIIEKLNVVVRVLKL